MTTNKVKESLRNEGIVTAQDDPILSFTDAGKMLGKHPSTISRWGSDGLILIHRHASGVPGVRLSEVKKLLVAAEGIKREARR